MSDNLDYTLLCPIWGTMAAEVQRDHENGRGTFYDSPRAGGKFLLSAHGSPLSMLQEIDVSVKARLTSWLIEQRRLGEEFPEVSCDSIENAKVRRPRRVKEKSDNFLRYLAQLEELHGYLFQCYSYIYNPENFLHSLAYLESTIDILDDQNKKVNGQKEIETYLKYLDKRGWIKILGRYSSSSKGCLTVDGNIRLEELDYTISSSSQAFMAMWFDSSMDEAWELGFKPGIEKAGYEPVRIDQRQHINKIDDEIISEIRRSRFVVADFTQGETGARGGVYYEAGFAHGLDIPVIFTCQKDWLKKIHFDIRQYNCITWERDDLKKLQEDLANRITAILGDGPGRSAS